ncbi:hypothetical protein HQ346_02335 [Rhodococcus sp. BP-252]|nr:MULTISPECIES: hypothetical protein [Rhodococcus]MBY6410390.1 hypothetical protein [Rhodococcus sp. BP-320]MBY6416272.1 hypothetical protein [Rhodococcus sp. BP-321]MBY6420267.1 hypothetical protein [Rhodococcus sp. BP-324]MBY6424946.1 hypothetical protein [Rhodococcus sp. BP-323]MBY6430348.1 hypothetical protein [Rhodococcus sp. BP-322]
MYLHPKDGVAIVVCVENTRSEWVARLRASIDGIGPSHRPLSLTVWSDATHFGHAVVIGLDPELGCSRLAVDPDAENSVRRIVAWLCHPIAGLYVST